MCFLSFSGYNKMKREIKKFNLTKTFENGQCFRWYKQNDESYFGIVDKEIVHLFYENNKLYMEGKNLNEDYLYNYFSLDEDYELIENEVKKIDKYLYKAVEFSSGMRLLKQDKLETIISFIISQNNNIKRIRLILENICKAKGKKLKFKGFDSYSFPTIEKLKELKIDDFKKLGAGYRDKYLFDAIDKIYNKEIDIDKISHMDLINSRQELMRIKGIGKKVADCILIFAYSRNDAFPIDTWIKKVLKNLYSDYIKKYSSEEEFIKNHFKTYQSIAQQYLFYYARDNKLVD